MKTKVLRRKAMARTNEASMGLPKDMMAPAEHEEMDPSEENDAKMHMHTLLEAEEIKKDQKKMAAVKMHAKRQMGKIRSIQDLKDMADAKGANKKNGGYVAS